MLKIITDNPYRILGVYANSPKKDIVANKGKATAFLKVGKSVEYPLDLTGIMPPVERTLDTMSKADSDITIAREQIKYAQFWFVKMTPLDDIAFNHLVSGDMDKAKEIWSKEENLSSLQNKMVCYLIEGYYEYALTEAEKLYERFGDEYVKEIDSNSTLQMNRTELFHQLIDLLGEEVGMLSLLECELEEETRAYIGEQAVTPLIEKITIEINKSKSVDRDNPQRRLSAAKRLISNTEKELQQLKDNLDTDDPRYQMIADKLGLEILQCGIDYYNNTEDDDAPQTAMKIQQYAQNVVVGSIARQRCEENVKILRKIIDNLPPATVMDEDKAIKAELAKYVLLPDKISHAITLLQNTKPHIQSIKRKLGFTNTYYLNISTQIVQNALHNVIEEVNDEQNAFAAKMQFRTNVNAFDLVDIRKVLKEAWTATTIMDEFDLNSDFKSHYNKNRSSLKSMCMSVAVSTNTGNSFTSYPTTSSTNRPTTTTRKPTTTTSNNTGSSGNDNDNSGCVIGIIITIIGGILGGFANGGEGFWVGLFWGGCLGGLVYKIKKI